MNARAHHNTQRNLLCASDPYQATLFDRLAFGGLLLACAASPWPFGSVEFYAIDVLAIWLLLLIGLWAIHMVAIKKLVVRMTPILWVLLLLVGLSVLQLVPLPFLPHRGIWQSRRISLDPPATLQVITKWSLLVGYFFLASQLLRTPRRLRILVNTLIIVGLCVALVGLLNKLTFNGKILWFRPSDYARDAFGPFVNRNHFAGFMELILPLPLLLIVGRAVERDRWIVYGFSALVMGTALLLSTSRGGLMALVVQLLFLPILAQYAWSQRHQHQRRQAGPTIGNWWRYLGGSVLLATSIIMATWWIGAEPITNRLSLADQFNQSRPILQQTRPAIWKSSLKLIQAHAVFGVGAGAYPTVFPHYDGSTGYFFVNAAHNDYIQGLAEMGIIGGLLGLAFLYYLARLIKQVLTVNHLWERAAGLAAAVGCIGLLAHSLVDFNLQIPSNALIFLILVAILDTTDWRTNETQTA